MAAPLLVKDLMVSLQNSSPHIFDTLTVPQLVHFSNTSADFLNRTEDAFPTGPTKAPIEFITHCLGRFLQPQATWAQLWYEMYPTLSECLYDTLQFSKFGIPSQNRGPDKFLIPENTFFPPNRGVCSHCIPATPNAPIPRFRNYPPICGYLMKISGIESVQYYTSRCEGCLTTYYPNFETCNGIRHYYTLKSRQTPSIIQVTQHYFMTTELVEHFNNLQVLAVVSIFNLVNSYNATHATKPAPNDFKNNRFQRHLTSHVCSLALDIHRLMRVYSRRGIRLRCPAKGYDNERFIGAMADHLEWLKHEGSKYHSHLCSICTHVKPIAHSPDASILRAVVTDGVTIGYWRCSASEEQLSMLEPGRTPGVCTIHLKSPKDRYCPKHQALLTGICEAQPCTSPCMPGKKTCKNPSHIEAHQEYIERNTSIFGLPRRLNRPGSSLPLDPSVLLDDSGEIEMSGEALHDCNVEDRGHEGARDGGESISQTKTCLSRCRTHNEQLVVATCGVILARKTFYKSEAISKVKEFLLEVFPDELPQIIFYDNACNLYTHINANPTDAKAFSKTLLPVDTFHFRSHKESHTTCRQNNDPHLFPELKKEDGSWAFNASAAEICNSWFGKFDSMCRNMKPIRYEFHLEVMIEARNDWLCEKIQKRPTTTFCANIPYKTIDL